MRRVGWKRILRSMFIVDEEAAAEIRRLYREQGEWPAVVEFKRHFPLISDNADALRCTRVIAGWRGREAEPGGAA